MDVDSHGTASDVHYYRFVLNAVRETTSQSSDVSRDGADGLPGQQRRDDRARGVYCDHIEQLAKSELRDYVGGGRSKNRLELLRTCVVLAAPRAAQ
ncbi:MAG: hypothetical protein BGO97_09525 [Micrococcales bacterium 70-64]|nr:MAG: hypothetical protein ABT06_09530 [Leifsonia sp. SCN 70-46]OJX85935.1 MAG: hypothetical protein BGO97_09525 [Micrococcales bacterium 70-64]